MSNSVRGNNSSPGIYFKETEVGYSAKSLGITSLGVAGETLRGPAFENVPIADWTEFETVFGGTSTKKFKGTQYPKYELPFIAKSYLTESRQLNVVRVLGLSGYNAGPAWYLKDANDKVIAVLRSRGHYEKYGKPTEGEDGCVTYKGYDRLVYDTVKVEFGEYTTVNGTLNCKTNTSASTLNYFEDGSEYLTSDDYGRLTIIATDTDNNERKYAVSLNAGERDYILTVLGTNPNDSSAIVYVEELYDVALGQSIANGEVQHLKKDSEIVKQTIYKNLWAPVSDILTIPEEELKRGHLGLRFIADSTGFTVYEGSESGYTETTSTIGDIVEVKYFRPENSTEEGFHYLINNKETWDGEDVEESEISETKEVVFVEVKGKYYLKETAKPYTYDLNNYKERFRSAMTPWFVSQLLGVGDQLNVKRLFRFITISDGNAANQEVKVSIEKVRPDEGLFDVIIRAYADSDTDPVVLEKYNKCSLDPQSSSYIGKKIGTANGEFELKSNYVMVEIADNDTIYGLVPCGFLGYPIRKISTESGETSFYDLAYNTTFKPDIRPRKQYFGLSDLTGVDIDVLNYKGVTAYAERETTENGYTHGFHLDMRLADEDTVVHVDEETGYTFDCVTATSQNGNGSYMIPVITTEPEMEETIYTDINIRKFTAFPYGGFDAWDDYRKQRTNTDDFKVNKYRGTLHNGEYENFTTLFDRAGLGLDGIKSMSSDYYAYLAAYRQFANPEAVDINLFATPGIDLINNTLLVDDVLNVIEDDDDGRNGDVLYIPTLPDKPAGASDAEEEMYTPYEITELVKDTEISDSYTATYYPWVKYYDQPSGTYIMLPPTKDVMRNFAYVDNHSAPWFAAAGTKEENGAVNCVKAHMFTRRQDENILYDNFINPVKTFAKDGVKIWGNKTLYFNEESPLNRINVRRLMLRVKKLISSAGRILIFDQNDGTLERQFRSIVEPILANVRDNRGIVDYRLDILNSVECEDEHEIQATIHIKPTPTLEWISISFSVYPTCVRFAD